MPVSLRIFTTFAVLAAPLFVHAQGSTSAVGKADQLVKTDKQLRAYKQPYILASSGSLIYDTCTTELAITEPEKLWFKKRYAALSNAYLQSFEDSYVARWKVPSDAGLTKDYVRYMNALRTPGIEKTSKSIATAGCTNRSVKEIVDYFRKIQAAEASGAQIPLAPIVKKRYN
jgi:hypothetical protein